MNFDLHNNFAHFPSLISRITIINAVYIGYKGQVLSMNVKALILI
jgi:hypothetical protein